MRTASTLVTSPYSQGNGYRDTLVNAAKYCSVVSPGVFTVTFFFFPHCVVVDIPEVSVRLFSSSWTNSEKREARDHNELQREGRFLKGARVTVGL